MSMNIMNILDVLSNGRIIDQPQENAKKKIKKVKRFSFQVYIEYSPR